MLPLNLLKTMLTLLVFQNVPLRSFSIPSLTTVHSLARITTTLITRLELACQFAQRLLLFLVKMPAIHVFKNA